MKKAALYVRVSTDQQTIENQVLLLTEVARRSGWEIVQVFADEGISGATGRAKRPGFDALLKAVARREVDIVAAFAVDRLGRSLSDLVGFLSEVQARNCDLYLYQQAIDTSTPAGRMLFQLLGVFAEFERTIIASRVVAGQARAKANGVKIRPPAVGAGPCREAEPRRAAVPRSQGPRPRRTDRPVRLGLADRTLGLRLPQKNRKAGADIRGRLEKIGLYRDSGHEHFNGSLIVPVFDGHGRIVQVYVRKIGDNLRPGTPLDL